MRSGFLTLLASALLAGAWALPGRAQVAEFDANDFGKIVIQPRQAAGGGGFVLEQAFGDYQNEPVVNYGENSQAVRLGRPIGRLDMLFSTGKTGFCTAFIVDENHILTNHHCMPGMEGDPSGRDSGVQAAQFVAGYINPGRAEGTDRYTVSPQIVETNRALDYTVLRVFGDPSAKYGRLELVDADPEDAEFLWIIGHPQGQSQHISREGCAAATPAISDEGKLVHTCDTLQGNSGSPVIRITDRRVVGLHHAGDSRTGFNQAIPMRRILAQSQVLRGVLPTGTRIIEPPRPAVSAPPPVAKAPPVTARGPSCDELWSEAKGMGCAGYEAYAEACADHTFFRMARRYVDRNCAMATAPREDQGNVVLTVRPGGGGDYRDLSTAVAEAPEGARIEVFPGQYTTGLDVDKPLEIVGVGRREDIVISVRDDNVIYWSAASGRIANLTLRQLGGEYFGVYFDSGGSATLEDSDLSSAGYAIIGAGDGANPVIRNNLVHDGAEGGIFLFEGASGRIEGNTIWATRLALIELKDGADPVVVRNTLRDGQTSGVYVHSGGRGRFEGNTFATNGKSGMSVSSGAAPEVRDNRFLNNGESGVFIYDGAAGVYENNVVDGSTYAGFAVKEDSTPVVRNNIVRNGLAGGLFIYDAGRGEFTGNEITGNTYTGIEVRNGGDPLVRSNRIYDNAQSAIWVHGGGRGTYENNDMRGNTTGFDLDSDAGPVVRVGNLE